MSDDQPTPNSNIYHQLLKHANVVPYPKDTHQLYYARLANSADKYDDALLKLSAHLTQR